MISPKHQCPRFTLSHSVSPWSNPPELINVTRYQQGYLVNRRNFVPLCITT
jgi:hypothetical protein